MKDFSGKLAVITGGGSGIGRAIVQQLTREGMSVAMCDLSEAGMAETAELALADAPQGVKVSCHTADVTLEDHINRFRDEALAEHETDHIHLLINNAGIGGGGSFLEATRSEWERTFNVCWYGVYYMCRAFMPALRNASEGHLVNVSSVNGFWASLGPDTPHTAYSAAKFAVKGFTEALINDLKINAPHIGVSVVMPGHIGTSIALNSMREHGADMTDEERAQAEMVGNFFRDNALTSPAQAAEIILAGVKDAKWRILVGPDALDLDDAVRRTPEDAYERSFQHGLGTILTELEG